MRIELNILLSSKPKIRFTIKLSIIHTVVGLLAFVIFLQTGWFMRISQISELPDVQRMIYRAGHIYFLFSGLLNLSIGMQLKISNVNWQRRIQYLGSTLLLLSPCILLYGFYNETNSASVDRIVTAMGVFISLGGIGLHTIVFLYKLIYK